MSILGWALSALGVGGVGLGALAFFMGPAALFGGVKAIFGVLAKIPWWVYVAAAIALAFAYLIHDRNKWKDRATAYNAEAVVDWHAAQKAAANPGLERKDTKAQILALGGSIKTLEDAVARQNAAVQALGDKTKAEQAQAAQAAQAAQKRADEAEATSARLKASAASAAGKTAAICEPSDVLKSQWSE